MERRGKSVPPSTFRVNRTQSGHVRASHGAGAGRSARGGQSAGAGGEIGRAGGTGTEKTPRANKRGPRHRELGRDRSGCDVESVAMKRLPDILTSATFWASIATMWAASGAWFTYVAVAVASRQQTYEGILNLIEGLEAELALVSEWAAGNECNQGYVSKTRAQRGCK